ncbi:hypothetical protein PhCBS80983_g03795 [Powellomyces hirtus]|uniref:Rab-GAP TBC domain-containing protein n=1 Tax=Powellomyces hirtus TaxID=109895 RepID=A0A507E0Z0_9FUNG|nr:hypothetical protein PhCBS80983_g03795 [Powellomyces hirtus]
MASLVAPRYAGADHHSHGPTTAPTTTYASEKQQQQQQQAPPARVRPPVDVIAGAAKLRHMQRLKTEQEAIAAAAKAAAAADAFEAEHPPPVPPTRMTSATSTYHHHPNNIRSGSGISNGNKRSDSHALCDPHRLTLGPLAAGEGFGDILARMDNLKFDAFIRTGGDPALVGKRFAEHVFDGVQWDGAAKSCPNPSTIPMTPTVATTTLPPPTAMMARRERSESKESTTTTSDKVDTPKPTLKHLIVDFKDNSDVGYSPLPPFSAPTPPVSSSSSPAHQYYNTPNEQLNVFRKPKDGTHSAPALARAPTSAPPLTTAANRFFGKAMLPWRSHANNVNVNHSSDSSAKNTHSSATDGTTPPISRSLKTQRSFQNFTASIRNQYNKHSQAPSPPRQQAPHKAHSMFDATPLPSDPNHHNHHQQTPSSASLPTLPRIPSVEVLESFPNPPIQTPFTRSHETLLMHPPPPPPPPQEEEYRRQRTVTATTSSPSLYTSASSESSPVRSIRSRMKGFLSKPASDHLTPPPTPGRKSSEENEKRFPLPQQQQPATSSTSSSLLFMSRSRSRSRSARRPPSPNPTGRSRSRGLRLRSSSRFRSRSRDTSHNHPLPANAIGIINGNNANSNGHRDRTHSSNSLSDNSSTSSTLYHHNNRTPRKSLDASSRKSSDRFFEFVDELYCRADHHGFVTYHAPKSRAEKVAESTLIARDTARARKWKLMARELCPPHPAVREAERQVAGGVRYVSPHPDVEREGGGMSNVPRKVAIVPLFGFVRSGKFVSRLRKGVPLLWRGHAWYHLFTALSGLYDRLTPDQIGVAEADLILKYHMLQDQPSSYDEDILLVVPKTFANHIWFMQRQGPGQQALTRLLTAYANYDPTVGSSALATPCGLNMLAAMLLTVMEEERAFITLVHLMHSPNKTPYSKPSISGGGAGGGVTPYYNGRALFAPSGEAKQKVGTHARTHPHHNPPLTTVTVTVTMDAEVRAVHDALIATHVPRVAARFKDAGVKTTAYAGAWYRSLFLALCCLESPPKRIADDHLHFQDMESDEEHDDDDDESDDPDDGNGDGMGRGRRGRRRREEEADAAAGGEGKRWEGILGFPATVRCWDFFAEVGWEGACVVAVAVLKWHEATLLSLPSDTLLPFLCNGATPNPDYPPNNNSHSNVNYTYAAPLPARIRNAVRNVPAPDPDRFMRLVRRVWDAR